MKNAIDGLGIFLCFIGLTLLLLVIPSVRGVIDQAAGTKLEAKDGVIFDALAVMVMVVGFVIFVIGRIIGPMGSKPNSRVVTRYVYRDRSAGDALDQLAHEVEQQE